MDIFGIGNAMKAIMRIYFQSSRCSGRTTSMIESLRDGDRVIFTTRREADRVKRLATKYGKDIICTTSPITENPLERGMSQARTVFDHSWVENFYLQAIERAEEDIKFFTKEMSGWNETVHGETKRQAEEIARWRI